MALNTEDFRLQFTLNHAQLIVYQNPELSEVLSPLTTMTEYKEHFQSWYGEHSAEYRLICAMVNLLNMIKTYTNTSSPREAGGKQPASLTLDAWLGKWPLRQALLIKLKNSIENPVSATGA
jgi:hypothetical protein